MTTMKNAEAILSSIHRYIYITWSLCKKIKRVIVLDYQRNLQQAGSVGEVFSFVEKMVDESLGMLNTDVTIQFSTIRRKPYVGGFYSPYLNIIVVNKTSLRLVLKKNPELVKPYLVKVLLHEYLHSVGILDEKKVAILTAVISYYSLGRSHIVTRLAAGKSDLFKGKVKHVSVLRIIDEELKVFFPIV